MIVLHANVSYSTANPPASCSQTLNPYTLRGTRPVSWHGRGTCQSDRNKLPNNIKCTATQEHSFSSRMGIPGIMKQHNICCNRHTHNDIYICQTRNRTSKHGRMQTSSYNTLHIQQPYSRHTQALTFLAGHWQAAVRLGLFRLVNRALAEGLTCHPTSFGRRAGVLKKRRALCVCSSSSTQTADSHRVHARTCHCVHFVRYATKHPLSRGGLGGTREKTSRAQNWTASRLERTCNNLHTCTGHRLQLVQRTCTQACAPRSADKHGKHAVSEQVNK